MRPVNKKLRDKYPWLAEPDILDHELQDAVNESEFWLCIHSAILYGLMEGDAVNIKVDRCKEVIEMGKKKGIYPVKGYISPAFSLEFNKKIKL